MQTIKEKIQDMSAMRQVKAEARAEEQAEKDLAKARMDVAREVRKAKEAEAQMDLHVTKAAERIDKEIAKHQELGANDPIVGITDGRQDRLPVSAGGAMDTTNNMTNTAAAKANPNPKLF